jgi:hypothetical protein
MHNFVKQPSEKFPIEIKFDDVLDASESILSCVYHVYE